MKKIILVVTILSTLMALLWSGIRIYKAVDFNIQCTGHLKRAADANTIDLAKNELKIVMDYLEKRNLTDGIVSIVLKQPQNDIGFWYQNLKSSYEELEQIKPDTTQLEKSNLLMKLRETLIDSGEELKVTCPNGISIYPNNMIYFIWGVIAWIICCIGWLYLLFSNI